MRHKSREVAFQATIDYGYQQRNKGMHLDRFHNPEFAYETLEQETSERHNLRTVR